MKTHYLTIAGAAAGLLLATSSASASPLAPTSAAPMGIDRLDTAVEQVHYRPRVVRRHFRPWRAPAITFGLGPAVTPFYGYPYRYSYYPHRPYRYAYPYPYAVGPTFSFGFHIR